MKKFFLFAAAIAAHALFAAPPAEITVDLKLDEISYVSGERIRGVISVLNSSPDALSVGGSNSTDRLIVEVFRASDYSQLQRVKEHPFTAAFDLPFNGSRKFETFLADNYALVESRRYLARPVFIHRGYRFEGLYRAFDVVPGMKVASALQMFSNRDGLSREFELLRWSRKGNEHLFLAAKDVEPRERKWLTTDIGPMMRITKPTISIMPGGEVIVFHRNGPDSFVRSEFWSLPEALEFRSRTMVLDPETAGQSRVREIYGEGGEVKPVTHPWWKFG